MTTTTDALRAGRLVLAVADGDLPQTITIMHETMTEPTGIIGLVTALASTTAQMAQLVSGDEWRAVLTTALHTLELEDDGLDDDDRT